MPESLQQYVLKELHEGHPGMVRMKSLARGHVYWPRLDQQLEELVGSCDDCRQYQTLPPKAPVNPWRWPTEPWQRIHVDFAGPFLGSMFLLVVDSHSKWPEVIPMKTTTAEKTITVMRKMFSRYGLPHTVVSDNGPQFVAHEFKEFLKKNNVELIKSAVKHPASNGEVERFVQTFKQSMKKSQNDSGNLHQKLDRFLLSYRVTPHSVTKETPSKLFLKRELRTRLSSLKPSPSTKLSKGQSHEVMEGSVRQFSVGDSVSGLDFRKHYGKWVTGVVYKVLGPVTYLIQVEGQTWKRHLNQIRSKSFSAQTQSDLKESQGTTALESSHSEMFDRLLLPDEDHESDTSESQVREKTSPHLLESGKPDSPRQSVDSQILLRRSDRMRKPNKILDL